MVSHETSSKFIEVYNQVYDRLVFENPWLRPSGVSVPEIIFRKLATLPEFAGYDFSDFSHTVSLMAKYKVLHRRRQNRASKEDRDLVEELFGQESKSDALDEALDALDDI